MVCHSYVEINEADSSLSITDKVVKGTALGNYQVTEDLTKGLVTAG